MALDEPNEKDQVVELDGLTYLVDTTLMNQAKTIKVDYMEDANCSGFAIPQCFPNQTRAVLAAVKIPLTKKIPTLIQ